MKVREFRRLEDRLAARHLVGVGLFAGNGTSSIHHVPAICGLVVTGANVTPTKRERDALTAALRETIAHEVPVLALSNAVGLAMEAAGIDPAEDGCRAVFLHHVVRFLDSEREIDQAIDQMARSPSR
jgi:hypothetical protein